MDSSFVTTVGILAICILFAAAILGIIYGVVRFVCWCEVIQNAAHKIP